MTRTGGNVLVSIDRLASTIRELSKSKILAVDTETTGLRPHHGDRPFCIIIANATDVFYFNLHPDHPEYLPPSLRSMLNTLFVRDILWVFHNAKFDLAMLKNVGLPITGKVHDTATVARLLRNDRLKMSLEACAGEIGLHKKDEVKAYVKAHNLFTVVNVPGKKTRVKRLHYDRVPFEIMQPYAEQDARITYDLAIHQMKVMQETVHKDAKSAWPSMLNVFENEQKLTHVLCDMERVGIPVDLDYCKEVAAFEASRMHDAATAFRNATGKVLKNSNKLFTEVFQGERFVYGKETKTGKVNPSFDSDVLRTFESPLARTVVQYRDAKSRSDFFQGFIFHADSAGVVHTNFNSEGTKTGRFSSSGPNLQNVTKPEEGDAPEPYPVRRAFIPPEGEALVMFDYEQMEYRLLLDYIGAKALISKVLEGYDVHQATADLAGVTRSQAKTVNFSIIYGSGIKALAAKLGVSTRRAEEIRNAIYAAVPELYEFVQHVQFKAEKRGFIFNWFGRRCHFPERRFAYRSVNHMIQGGCADVVKIAMVRCHEYLRGRMTKMRLNIHDELVFTARPSEFGLLPGIKDIMEGVYRPKNGLKLTCGVDHSFKSLADKVEGHPSA